MSRVLLAISLTLWIFGRFDESRPEAARLVALSESVLRSLACVLREPCIMGFVLCAALNAVVFFTYLVSAAGLLIGTYRITPDHFGWIFAVNAIGFVCSRTSSTCGSCGTTRRSQFSGTRACPRS